MQPISQLFHQQELLKQALTHRSYCNEHPGLSSNERLEFLGDSVLSLVISHRLYQLFPRSPEGELTSIRSYLVKTATLAVKSQGLHLNEMLLLSKGEEESGGRQNPGLLANTFEAVLGALFIDQGLSTCYSFLESVFPDSEVTSGSLPTKDPKSKLQELAQAKGLGTPTYHTVAAVGPDHAKQFNVAVKIGVQILATGEGASKQRAETAAAKNALSSTNFP